VAFRVIRLIRHQAVLFAIGAPLSFLPGLAVCAHWFKRRLAFAIGFPVGAASIGGIIYPIMLNRLIPKIGFGASRSFSSINLT
jgi:hypothetical protein